MDTKDLAEKSGISWVMIGKYERGEVATKIADALKVTIDYLVGASSQTALERRTLDRIQNLEQLKENKKQKLHDLIDTHIRDMKARRAYKKTQPNPVKD